jgi:hypothetical protein
MDLTNLIYSTFYALVGIAFFGVLFIVYKSAYLSKNKVLTLFLVAVGLFSWLTIQAYLANNEFYTNSTEEFPPRLIFAILPPLLLIIYLSIYQGDFMRSLSGKWMTFFHVIRVPVELVLYGLFLEGEVPELMTFSGRNYDILIGLSAPVISMLFYSNTSIHKPWVIIWNFIGLALLANVVIHGILSTPYPFQVFAFDQANIAVLKYPVIWLPSFVVPSVLFFHLACLKQLLVKDHPGY